MNVGDQVMLDDGATGTIERAWSPFWFVHDGDPCWRYHVRLMDGSLREFVSEHAIRRAAPYR